MITITTLLIVFVLIAVIGLFFLGVGGVTVLLIFGDVIIGGLIVYWIIKTISKHDNN